MFAFIVSDAGFVVPLTAPLHPLNAQPAFAVAVNVTTVPEPYTPPAGFSVTLPRPVAFVVNVYVTVYALELFEVPIGFVTLMTPEVAPAGTDAVRLVPELTEKVAGVPLKATLVVPVKNCPVRVTGVPTAPLGGLNALMTGVPGCSVTWMVRSSLLRNSPSFAVRRNVYVPAVLKLAVVAGEVGVANDTTPGPLT